MARASLSPRLTKESLTPSLSSQLNRSSLGLQAGLLQFHQTVLHPGATHLEGHGLAGFKELPLRAVVFGDQRPTVAAGVEGGDLVVDASLTDRPHGGVRCFQEHPDIAADDASLHAFHHARDAK